MIKHYTLLSWLGAQIIFMVIGWLPNVPVSVPVVAVIGNVYCFLNIVLTLRREHP